MTAQDRNTNKALFEDGDKPDGTAYSDLIDSFISVADTTAQSMSSNLTVPKLIASSEVSSPQVNATEVSASAGSFKTLNATEVSASAGSFKTLNVGPSGEQGRPVLSQSVTITNAATANTTVAVMASGSNVLDAYFFVSTAFGTAASDVEVRLGDADNETKYGTFSLDTNIATGMHHLSNGAFTSAGTSWLSVAGSAKTILAKVTAVSGALASLGSGHLNIVYVSE